MPRSNKYKIVSRTSSAKRRQRSKNKPGQFRKRSFVPLFNQKYISSVLNKNILTKEDIFTIIFTTIIVGLIVNIGGKDILVLSDIKDGKLSKYISIINNNQANFSDIFLKEIYWYFKLFVGTAFMLRIRWGTILRRVYIALDFLALEVIIISIIYTYDSLLARAKMMLILCPDYIGLFAIICAIGWMNELFDSFEKDIQFIKVIKDLLLINILIFSMVLSMVLIEICILICVSMF